MMRFPDGSKICFIGDSLTAHNEILSRIVDKYNKSFPGENIEFFNCGTSGGTIGSALNFFYDDVLSHNPTHAVIAFGINDSERWHLESPRSESRLTLLKKAFEKYKDNLIKYCDMLNSHGIKIILCTPAPYDEYSNHAKEALKGGYSLMLGYSEFIRSYAKENGFDTVTSVLGISRYKDMEQVNKAARQASQETGVHYDETNWRKGGLEQLRQQLVKETEMYAQDYCGCPYSKRNVF